MKIILILLSLWGHSAFSQNLNQEFNKNLSSFNLNGKNGSLRNYKIIILRGLFNNYVSQLNDFLLQMGAPFEEKKYAPWTRERDFLKSLGLDVEIGPFETEGSPEKNGESLFNVIKKSKMPVILISHSKGGIDVLYGLSAHPDIWNKVAGWISIQSPLYGTPLADMFLENPIASFGLRTLIQNLMGGDFQAIESLSVKNMQLFHKQNQRVIGELVKKVNILSVGSYFKVKNPLENIFIPMGEKSAFAILNNTLRLADGSLNDGFTTISTTCLKGTPCLILANMDHGSFVADLEPFFTFNKIQRAKMIFSLLKMIQARVH